MTPEQSVWVTVSGIDEAGEVSLSTRGTLSDLPGGWLLRYEETNPESMDATETLVHCEGNRVTVTRTGTVLSTLVFDENETFVGDYPTPVGSFQIRVYASEVSIKRRGLIGHVHLLYQISLSSILSPQEEMATRTLDIRFTPCKR